MGLPVEDVKMGLPVHDSFGWILAAGVSLWWLHNREVNLDVPSDLATNYIMVPVPTGRRSFIIAGYGTTCHYSR